MSFRDKTDKLLNTAMDVFGERNKVEYRPKTGGTFTIRGIFDEAWEEVDPETEVMISSTQPNVGVKLNELSFKPVVGDQLTVLNQDFDVVEVVEDGQGGATLVLHRKS